jgi:hypothetical protein
MYMGMLNLIQRYSLCAMYIRQEDTNLSGEYLLLYGKWGRNSFAQAVGDDGFP